VRHEGPRRRRAAEERYERAPVHYSITSSALASSRQDLAGSGTQLHCARFQSAPGSNLPPIREDRSTLPIENQSFVNSGEGVLSLHFLFQDLTQYQE